MPTYTHSAFTLSDAHAAAESRGYRPSRLGDRQRFNFSSAACHGGNNAAGCWAREVDGRIYFHCHKHGGNKADRLETQRRTTENLGLPAYRSSSSEATIRRNGCTWRLI